MEKFTDITLAYTAEVISVEVLTTRRRSVRADRTKLPPGHRLIGMRERVAVFGREFSASPRPGSGFRIAVRLPDDGSRS